MKNLQRFESRMKFIIKHSYLFKTYSKIKGYPQSSHPTVKQISKLARKEIGYSNKTVSCDIAWSLYKLYQKITNIFQPIDI